MDIAVLISGRGSNLKAMLEHQQAYKIKHVISNNFAARGIEIAAQFGVTNTYINWHDPSAAESELTNLLNDSDVGLIVLAGFMKILSPQFVGAFENQIINIHPSLLPKYPGLNTHQKVIDNQDSHHGATIHLVNEALDQGQILSQTKLKVDPTMNAIELAQQLILKEHKLLTTTVGLIADHSIQWDEDQVTYKNKLLDQPFMVE